MDFIEGPYGRIFYTEKELNLHVNGISQPCQRLPDPTEVVANGIDFFSDDELRQFCAKGFISIDSAVDPMLLRNARIYVNSQYSRWLKLTKRQDDWRCHLMLDLTQPPDVPIEHPDIIKLLLHSPKLINRIYQLTKSSIAGIFYSQIAFRTPLPAKFRKHGGSAAEQPPDYSPGAEYHLDGQANSSGTRFPDPWSLLVGVALVDIVVEDMGNFTVFPGFHTSRDWSRYPEEKRTKTLPDLGTPVHVCLRAGDAVIAHVLLPHRGGKNVLDLHPAAAAAAQTQGQGQGQGRGKPAVPPASSFSSCCENVDSAETDTPVPSPAPVHSNRIFLTNAHGRPVAWNFPENTREMVFLRVRHSGVDYEAPDRAEALLQNPWGELPGVLPFLPAGAAAAAESAAVSAATATATATAAAAEDG
jgi:hypothetical protein